MASNVWNESFYSIMFLLEGMRVYPAASEGLTVCRRHKKNNDCFGLPFWRCGFLWTPCRPGVAKSSSSSSSRKTWCLTFVDNPSFPVVPLRRRGSRSLTVLSLLKKSPLCVSDIIKVILPLHWDNLSFLRTCILTSASTWTWRTRRGAASSCVWRIQNRWNLLTQKTLQKRIKRRKSLCFFC